MSYTVHPYRRMEYVTARKPLYRTKRKGTLVVEEFLGCGHSRICNEDRIASRRICLTCAKARLDKASGGKGTK